MSDSDKDTSAAIDKVVGAFRAQREQGRSDSSESAAAESAAEEVGAAESGAEASATEPTQEPTPVKKLDDAPAPQGGGGSEAPTKAFKIPAEVAAAAAAAQTGPDSAAGDLREENVVGDPISAEPVDATAAAATTDDAKTAIIEQSIDLPAGQSAEADDAAATRQISADEVAAAAAAAKTESVKFEKSEEPASDAPTTQMKVPAAPAAGAAAATAAAAAPVAPKPEPQVVAPTQGTEEKRKSGKLVAIVLAAIVVIAVIAIGAWYLLVGSSDQNKVADAAKDYQSAMASGDLDSLKNITCGEKLEYYSSVKPEEFAKAYQAQQSRNEMLTFDDVKAVEIDGDVARVEVDMYSSNDPAKTTAAQITLQNIDGTWKVCTRP
ncbi:nuclear transport factor 2 family protein [Gordonia sp. (in: high G+C Gram-positive bacteria)]|uniref:Rv0361 family membrane protein n=1 Tax=Gordonia sp. (in: high G+C Gram-positive bacteria) TaxID=84139 RepID=UPI0016BD5E90|nr:nuclear transport factor 2 family protein [Gordonia sp. (in: high G+C Gram-positive bacteria)]NLG45752.1 hypothetical protein [Gordonia sp. (in: high G+C Gram-positive bacteria)]